MTDNGPQFASREFASFAEEIGMRHVTSSPHYPQANGMAERAVQTVKRFLKSSVDPYMALLSYRSTPLENGYSPAELLFNRRLRTTVPLTVAQRQPSVPDQQHLRSRTLYLQSRQQRNYNDHHRARSELPQLEPGTKVFLKDRLEHGTIVSSPAPRSYIVSTPSGEFRRNRRHINQSPRSDKDSEPVPQDTAAEEKEQPAAPSSEVPSLTPSSTHQLTTSPPSAHDYTYTADSHGTDVTRSGRVSRPPTRLDL